MRELRSSEVFSNNALRVIAVESVNRQRNQTKTFSTFIGTIEPLAVIVCGPDAITAYDMAAKPADLAQLRQDIPELNATITAYERKL